MKTMVLNTVVLPTANRFTRKSSVLRLQRAARLATVAALASLLGSTGTILAADTDQEELSRESLVFKI